MRHASSSVMPPSCARCQCRGGSRNWSDRPAEGGGRTWPGSLRAGQNYWHASAAGRGARRKAGQVTSRVPSSSRAGHPHWERQRRRGLACKGRLVAQAQAEARDVEAGDLIRYLHVLQRGSRRHGGDGASVRQGLIWHPHEQRQGCREESSTAALCHTSQHARPALAAGSAGPAACLDLRPRVSSPRAVHELGSGSSGQ